MKQATTTAHAGFTLVELAIVITIIGLLIGGVLKGQELLQNARMTSAAAQVKALDTAMISFKDVYKALPGDIISPGNFLQNCTTSPCNNSGNQDGFIGNGGSTLANNLERNNVWQHLARAGLINGIDTNNNWSAPNYFGGSYIPFKLGGVIMLYYYTSSASSYSWNGNYWILGRTPTATGDNLVQTIPLKVFGLLDLKVDDGKPYTGEYTVYGSACTISGDIYNPADTQACPFIAKPGF